ncbi:MAG: ribosome small subunit-dependent GTPase A [Actinomycetota bacterium]|nr:ribosome small subunit-dependent GTPase A [Actinomycetota bacterium]
MRQWDEDDVRVRPRRGKSRPRSKDRPTHSAGAPGRIIAVDRGRFTAVLEDADRSIYAVKARELGRKSVVVGDAVWLTGDLRGGPDRLARVVRIEPRTTVLRRSADDADPDERVIVANAEQLAVVTSLADPEPSPGLIDRCLVAAYDAGLSPLLILTKSDLADPAHLLDLYDALDVPAVVCGMDSEDNVDPEGLDELTGHLVDRVTCFVGHSGVGKSTLVNALIPSADRQTGVVNVVTGRGRHTSSQAVAIPLAQGGWLIDTPGVRSFGLAHVEPDRVMHAFTEFDEAIEDCPRGCPHTTGAQDCALDAFAASGGAGESGVARLESLRRLLATRPPEPGARGREREATGGQAAGAEQNAGPERNAGAE